MIVRDWAASGPSAVRSRKLASALIIPTMLAAGPVQAQEQAVERVTATLVALDMAQTACGFRIVHSRVAALVASVNMTRDQLYRRPVTPVLQEAINGLQDSFARNVVAACTDAWARFGSSSEAALLAR